MVNLLVHHIEFADIRPLNVVLILMGVFKVYFTAWLNSTAVEDHLVRKTMVHIEYTISSLPIFDHLIWFNIDGRFLSIFNRLVDFDRG